MLLPPNQRGRRHIYILGVFFFTTTFLVVFGKRGDVSCALNSLNIGNGYAVRKTWRLPSRQELETLPDYGLPSPTINVIAFPATVALEYWSSTTYAPSTANAWSVSFAYNGNALEYFYLKTSNYYMRCVSGQ